MDGAHGHPPFSGGQAAGTASSPGLALSGVMALGAGLVAQGLMDALAWYIATTSLRAVREPHSGASVAWGVALLAGGSTLLRLLRQSPVPPAGRATGQPD